MEPHLFDFEWVVRGEGWGAKTASSNLVAVDPWGFMTAINLVEQIDFGLTLNVKKGYNPLKPFQKEMTMKIN